MTMTLTIDKELPDETVAPLYFRFDGAFEPGLAHLCLTENGHVFFATNGEPGGGVPMHVHEKRTLQWSVSPYLNRERALALLDDSGLQAALERVHRGHSVHRRACGPTDVSFTEDAKAATQDVQAILDLACAEPENLVQVWDLDDWLFSNGLHEAWPADVPLDKACEALELAAVEDEPHAHVSGASKANIRDSLIDRVTWCEDIEDLTGEHLKTRLENRPSD